MHTTPAAALAAFKSAAAEIAVMFVERDGAEPGHAIAAAARFLTDRMAVERPELLRLVHAGMTAEAGA